MGRQCPEFLGVPGFRSAPGVLRHRLCHSYQVSLGLLSSHRLPERVEGVEEVVLRLGMGEGELGLGGVGAVC